MKKEKKKLSTRFKNLTNIFLKIFKKKTVQKGKWQKSRSYKFN